MWARLVPLPTVWFGSVFMRGKEHDVMSRRLSEYRQQVACLVFGLAAASCASSRSTSPANGHEAGLVAVPNVNPGDCPAVREAAFGSTLSPMDHAASEYRDGLSCFRAGAYLTAAEHFALANRTVFHPHTTFNLALSYDRAGMASRAIEQYEVFLTVNTEKSEKARFARQRIERLRAGLPSGCTGSEKIGGMNCISPHNVLPY